MSNEELGLRIMVVRPPKGVAFAVQRGRSELVPPVRVSADALTFDVTVRLGRVSAGNPPRFLGPVVQGPAAARVVYVNSGKRAGQPLSCWDRRAKVPLGGITWAHIEALRSSPGRVLEARIAGTARDGGPACASVPLLEPGWQVAPHAG